MFVIHTPDGEMYAHHEGEEEEDFVGEGDGGIIRDRQDREISIPKFLNKYPQISKIKELQNTKHGKEFNAIPTAIDSPEKVSEILKNDKSTEKLIHKAVLSKHFNSNHVSEILSDPSKHHILYNFDVGAKHFTTDHLDHVLDNSNRVETGVQDHMLNKILDHSPEKLEPRHIDKILDVHGDNKSPPPDEKEDFDFMTNYENDRRFFYQKEVLQNSTAVLPRHIQHILDNKEKYDPKLSELAVREGVKRYPLTSFHNQSQ